MIRRESLGSAMQPNCPLVIIRWQDSRQPCGSWRFLSSLPATTAVEVATVGWLLRDDAEVMVVCQNVGDLDNPQNAQASGIMTIPTRCVLSVERLTEVDGPTSSAGSGSADIADRNFDSARTPPAL
jgi:hypothetical protein